MRLVNLKYLLSLIALCLIDKMCIACDCGFTPSIHEAIANSDVIFTAKIERKNIVYYLVTDTLIQQVTKNFAESVGYLNIQAYYEYSLQNMHFVKGGSTYKKNTILTPIGKATCEYAFEVGKKYIVYASEVSKPNMRFYLTNSCSRTMLYNKREKQKIKHFFR